MRLIGLLILALVLTGCSKTGDLVFGKTAYEIRPLASVGANAYEAIVISPDQPIDPSAAQPELFRRMAARLKADGYDRMTIDPPTRGTYVSSTTVAGRTAGERIETRRYEFPGLSYRVKGYKSGDDVPATAVAVSDYLGGTGADPASAPAVPRSSVRRNQQPRP